MLKDETFMRFALRLAAKAQGRTHPNPMVGAVVVRSGRILGQGYHRQAGQPHAEVLALAQAGALAKGATLYVSLEPCAHTGQTPPCTEAIRRAGIRRVVAAMVDPNPKNRGKGIRRLRTHGIRTKVGILEDQARRLNRVFVTWMTKGRPFVTVKVAQSLDGKIATRTGESRWISGPKARAWVHRLRSEVDAILVGIETLLKDDPELTVRLAGLKGSLKETPQPAKCVLDSQLRTPASAKIFSSGSPVFIATTALASHLKADRLRRSGAEVLRLPSQNGKVSLKAFLKALSKKGISHLLVEGGAEVIASAFKAHVVDRIVWIITPKILGGRQAPSAVGGAGIASLSQAIPLRNLQIRRLGSDLIVTADV